MSKRLLPFKVLLPFSAIIFPFNMVGDITGNITRDLGKDTGKYQGVRKVEKRSNVETFEFQQTAFFNPPPGWRMADPSLLPQSVLVMVVGKGQHEYPPSINLSTDRFNGTLKQYLKLVKSINDTKGFDWKDLGTIRTKAGEASLSQLDEKTEWGVVRKMQVIYLDNNIAYILTAAALREEFSKFYPQIFQSMRSFNISDDPLDVIENTEKQEQLQIAIRQLQEGWQKLAQKGLNHSHSMSDTSGFESVFQSDEFQHDYWIPFQEVLNLQYADLGPKWQEQVLKHVKSILPH